MDKNFGTPKYKNLCSTLKGYSGCPEKVRKTGVNLMLAASAMNFKRMMNLWKKGRNIFAQLLNELLSPVFMFAKHGNQIQALKTTF
jgi:hypothetical protein